MRGTSQRRELADPEWLTVKQFAERYQMTESGDLRASILAWAARLQTWNIPYAPGGIYPSEMAGFLAQDRALGLQASLCKRGKIHSVLDV